MKRSEEIYIENAGIILLHRHLPTLFNRLSLTSNVGFTDLYSCHKALQTLHFISAGQEAIQETYLPLNHILCGISVAELPSLTSNLRIEDELITEGMLSTAISSWPQVRSSMIDTFRKNWLLREGVLKESENGWELKVETRGQDILLKHSPFSPSVIRYSWMDKPLRVSWDY